MAEQIIYTHDKGYGTTTKKGLKLGLGGIFMSYFVWGKQNFVKQCYMINFYGKINLLCTHSCTHTHFVLVSL